MTWAPAGKKKDNVADNTGSNEKQRGIGGHSGQKKNTPTRSDSSTRQKIEDQNKLKPKKADVQIPANGGGGQSTAEALTKNFRRT